MSRTIKQFPVRLRILKTKSKFQYFFRSVETMHFFLLLLLLIPHAILHKHSLHTNFFFTLLYFWSGYVRMLVDKYLSSLARYIPCHMYYKNSSIRLKYCAAALQVTCLIKQIVGIQQFSLSLLMIYFFRSILCVYQLPITTGFLDKLLLRFFVNDLIPIPSRENEKPHKTTKYFTLLLIRSPKVLHLPSPVVPRYELLLQIVNQ